MKYIFCFVLLIFLVCEYSKAETLQLTNFHRNYRDYQNENLLEELNYAENQILQKNEKEEPLLTKLEKLEIILFGAIQAGELGYRIGNVYKNSSLFYNDGYGRRNFYPHCSSHYYPYYSLHRPNSPRYYYENYPPQPLLPKNYSLGTTVRIMD